MREQILFNIPYIHFSSSSSVSMKQANSCASFQCTHAHPRASTPPCSLSFNLSLTISLPLILFHGRSKDVLTSRFKSGSQLPRLVFGLSTGPPNLLFVESDPWKREIRTVHWVSPLHNLTFALEELVQIHQDLYVELFTFCGEHSLFSTLRNICQEI